MGSSRLMNILFGAVIIMIPVITIVMPKNTFSQNENRLLAEFPELTAGSVLDRSYMEGFEDYLSDHFLARERWIVVKNKMESLSGKAEIKGVITLDENQMIEVWKAYDDFQLGKNIDLINEFAGKYQNKRVSVMLVPTMQGIFPDKMPKNIGALNQESFIKYCYDGMNEVREINVFEILSWNREKYIYYRTDHHWTSLGAYFAYEKYCADSGISPYGLSDFTIKHASKEFRGTLYSKTLDSSATPDVIDYYLLKEGEPEVSVQMGGEVHSGLYFEEYLKEKDKYSSFLGTNTGLVNIDSNVDSEKSLLIIKDSYAHSLIPFLTKHYSHITMLDLRYSNKRQVEEVELDSYSKVLFLYNAKTFSENVGLNLLTYID